GAIVVVATQARLDLIDRPRRAQIGDQLAVGVEQRRTTVGPAGVDEHQSALDRAASRWTRPAGVGHAQTHDAVVFGPDPGLGDAHLIVAGAKLTVVGLEQTFGPSTVGVDLRGPGDDRKAIRIEITARAYRLREAKLEDPSGDPLAGQHHRLARVWIDLRRRIEDPLVVTLVLDLAARDNTESRDDTE